MQVKKARREKQKLIAGFMGPSGAGKTFSALIVAFGMMKAAYPQLGDDEVWAKIGVADTEHERSLLYFGRDIGGGTKIGEFIHVDFEAPYTTARYQEAVSLLIKEGAEIIIIDSLSHNWAGEGGIVEVHDNMAGNSFQNWGKLAKESYNLIKTLTRNDVHIICTMRTKQKYVMEQTSEGKMQPVKLGLEAVQKDEMEYEFMLNFKFDMNHMAKASKDNTHLFGEEELQLTIDDGIKLFRWLELGVDVKAEEAKLKAEREEAEENERQQLLGEILKAVESNEEIKKELAGLEYKANETKVSDFNLKTMRRAHEILIKK